MPSVLSELLKNNQNEWKSIKADEEATFTLFFGLLWRLEAGRRVRKWLSVEGEEEEEEEEELRRVTVHSRTAFRAIGLKSFNQRFKKKKKISSWM